MSELKVPNKDNLKSQILIGESAARLLDNPDYIQMMTLLEADLIRKWGRTKDAESDKREELYKDSKALERIRHYLGKLQDSAKMAAKQTDAK